MNTFLALIGCCFFALCTAMEVSCSVQDRISAFSYMEGKTKPLLLSDNILRDWRKGNLAHPKDILTDPYKLILTDPDIINLTNFSDKAYSIIMKIDVTDALKSESYLERKAKAYVADKLFVILLPEVNTDVIHFMACEFNPEFLAEARKASNQKYEFSMQLVDEPESRTHYPKINGLPDYFTLEPWLKSPAMFSNRLVDSSPIHVKCHFHSVGLLLVDFFVPLYSILLISKCA